MNEKLYPIDGFENYFITKSGKVWSKNRNRFLKNKIDKKGYCCIGFRANGSRKEKKIHRLLAEIFIPNPENKPQINHINGIKNDNSIENLEWVTNEENMKHAFKTGLVDKKGEKNQNAKLNDAKIIVIRRLLERGNMTTREIGSFFGVAHSQICAIKLNKAWTHV